MTIKILFSSTTSKAKSTAESEKVLCKLIGKVSDYVDQHSATKVNNNDLNDTMEKEESAQKDMDDKNDFDYKM